MKIIVIEQSVYALTEKDYKKCLKLVAETERLKGDEWYDTLKYIENKGKLILHIDNAYNY